MNWWRGAAIYQVYPRSFADGNGDGIGDLAGLRQKLPYLAELGVDAIWLSPWYPSPLADGGYDVADYRVIDPAFGTLAEAEKLIVEARELGIRTLVDIVPNHVSSEHPWFQAALADPAAPERDYFWFRPGRGANGEQMPTDWRGEFGGTTWTRTTNPDGTPGDWYLHLFTPAARPTAPPSTPPPAPDRPATTPDATAGATTAPSPRPPHGPGPHPPPPTPPGSPPH